MDTPVPPITIKADKQVLNPGSKAFTLDGNASLKAGDEFSLEADHIAGSLSLSDLDASGNLLMREMSTYLTASTLKLNALNQSGSVSNALIRRYPLTATATLIDIKPNKMIMRHALLTTSPPGDKPFLAITADKIEMDQEKNRMNMRNASFFIGGHRLITIPTLTRRLHTQSSGGLGGSNLKQSFGYNGYDKVYVDLSKRYDVLGLPVNVGGIVSTKGIRSVRAFATYTLCEPAPIVPPPATSAAANVLRMVRLIAQVDQIPVPEGDRLRFHDFTTTSPIEQIFAAPLRGLTSTVTAGSSYNEPFYARRVSDLRVSRVGEAVLKASVPVGAVRPEFPIGVNPEAARHILRRPEYIFSVEASDGYYRETPTKANGNRQALQARIESRPFLVAPDVLVRPALTINSNRYGHEHNEYKYTRASIAVQKVYTDLTGIGFEYSAADTSGSSPFVFDTLDTSQELDLRAQYGDKKVILGAVLQYDLARHNVYTAIVSVGANMHFLVPRVTYDTRSRNIGIGLDVAGLSY
ncbi:MAG TPA: hypothetical protein VGK19_20405 [Capsulimonadaceae bacterium]